MYDFNNNEIHSIGKYLHEKNNIDSYIENSQQLLLEKVK